MGPPVMEPPEPASAPPASSSEPPTESAWERGLRHAKEVSFSRLYLLNFELNVSLLYIYDTLPRHLRCSMRITFILRQLCWLPVQHCLFWFTGCWMACLHSSVKHHRPLMTSIIQCCYVWGFRNSHGSGRLIFHCCWIVDCVYETVYVSTCVVINLSSYISASCWRHTWLAEDQGA